jgi:hypothetical protein
MLMYLFGKKEKTKVSVADTIVKEKISDYELDNNIYLPYY